MMEIGENIHREMKKKKMTQRELAELIGTSEASISRYIKGTRVPKASTAAKIAIALGTTMDTLLRGRVEKMGVECEKPEVYIKPVFCKDCIYYNRGWSVKYEMHMMFCDHFRVGCGNRSYPEDFFCGFGERREEE